jgi:hypothetical protein
MLEISLEGTTRIDSIGRHLRVATEKKMIELTDLMYEKVMENVSGKILNKQTGQLAGSIHKENASAGDFYLGSVYVSPVTDKAWVLEKGGKGYYPITATKASVLHFFSKSGEEVFTKSVNHPPSKEFAYLRRALEEMEDVVPRGFRDYIQTVLDGGDYS